MWVIYVRGIYGHLKSQTGLPNWKFWPLTDVNGDTVGYGSRESAAPRLYEEKQMRGTRNAYLQKVGPWS